MEVNTDDATEVAQALMSYLNRSSTDGPAALVTALSTQHRTLQQVFTNVTITWLRHLDALPFGQYDLRNEASVTLARKLSVALDEATYGATRLPMV